MAVDATADVILDEPPATVTVNGRRVDAAYDGESNVLTVPLQAGRASEVLIR